MSTGQQGWGTGQPMRFPPPPAPVKPVKPIKRWMWWSGGCAVVVLLAAAAWGGVRLWRMFQGSGKEQITQLHREMIAQDAGAIFAEADPGYQRDVGRERSDELFAVVRERMGDPVSYSVQNVNASTSSKEGQVEELVLGTKFTKGEATETLKYHKVDGVWRMIAYHCNSELLRGVVLKSKRGK